MLSIVKILRPEGITLKEIKKFSGACTQDSIEVMNMLKYLTSIGRVKEENKMFYIEYFHETSVKIPRRKILFIEVVTLLECLSETPQSLSILTDKTNWTDSEEKVKLYLQFLVRITEKGFIQGGISIYERLLQKGKWLVT
jgi:hypothetical protein